MVLARDGNMGVLRIADTGAGIAPDILPRIFDLFVQGESSLARSQGGLGVGLTLARRLVELHGGTVEARSAGPGRGSEFEVRVPLAAPAAVRAPAAAPAGPPRPRRILVIEDSSDARELLRVVLEMAGHTVRLAPDGRRGVAFAAEDAPDVAIVDIGLPGLDGYEVARQIRKRLGAAVRLIALTGYGDVDARRRGAEAGFDDYLVKPVLPERLLPILSEA